MQAAPCFLSSAREAATLLPPGAFEGSVEKFNLESFLERLRDTEWNANHTATITQYKKQTPKQKQANRIINL